MADIKKIKIGSHTYDIRDGRIITLTDSGSTTAGTWVAGTGSPTQNLTGYSDGQLFLYKITKAGSSTTTLNIDGLGAKTVYRSGTSKLSTQYAVGQYLLLAYNSTNDCFRVLNDYDANTNNTHSGIGKCTTDASTAAKVVTFPNFALSTNQTILIRVDTTNTATSSVTLNVNNTGAKSIKIEGTAWSTTNQLVAGDYLATYDGTYWNLIRVYLDAHPTHTAKSEGLYKVTVDSMGHVSSATSVTKSDITALGIPAQDTTYASKSATSGGTAVSLVTTGEKYTWNNKQAAISDLATIRSNASTGATHADSTHARTDATKVEDSTTNGNIKINGTETNVYTHPTYTAAASGLYKVTVDATGHVSEAVAVTKSDITDLGIPENDTNTTYTIATGTSNGKIKVTPSSGDAYEVSVKGLGSAAYTASTAYMPAGDTSHGTHVTSATVKSALGTGTGTSKYLREDGTWVTPPNTTYSNATTSKAGLMSAADKTNLDTLVTSFSSDDSNTTINTIKEVLTAFENAPEGTDIANALAAKSNIGHTHEVTTSDAAPSGHTHNVTVSGTTGANGGTAVKAVTGYGSFSGGSGNLTSDTTSTDGIKYVEAVSGGSAVSPTTKYMKFSAGTTPKSEATPVHTSTNSSTNSGDAITAVTGVEADGTETVLTGVKASSTDTFLKEINAGSGSLVAYDAATNGTAKVTNGNRIPVVTSVIHTAASLGTASTGTVSISGGSYSGTTKYMKVSTTAADTGTVGISGGSGNLTIDTTSTNGIGVLTAQGTFSQGSLPSLTITSASPSKITSWNTGSMTHGIVTDGVLYINTGTAPSLSYETVSVGSASDWKAGTLPTLGNATTKYLHHTHTAASLTGTKTFATNGIKAVSLSASTTSTDGPAYTESISGSAPSLGGTKTFVTGYNSFSGGSITPTTYYLAHGHTGASTKSSASAITAVGADGTATVLTGVKASGTATVAPNEHTHTYDKTTSVTLKAGTAPSMNFNTGSSSDTPYISAVSGGSAVSVTTKYLHHTHTGASLGTATTQNVAPSGHTHSYGSATALTTTGNSGTAVAAVTEVKADE